MRRKISPKFHVKNGVKNGKFHANFTLPGRSAEKPYSPKPCSARFRVGVGNAQHGMLPNKNLEVALMKLKESLAI